MARVTFRNAMIITAVLAVAAPAGAQLYSDGTIFLRAVENREGDEATELLNRPGSTVVNSRDLTTGGTGLHITAARRDLTWTRFLLQEGANPNIADNSGRTPLLVAAQLGWVEGVTALVNAGARIDVTNQAGETPLISAVHARNIEMIEALMESGADPDRADNTGRSARDYASQPGMPARVLAAIVNSEGDDGDGSGGTYGPEF